MSSVPHTSSQDDVRSHITASLCAQRAPDGTPEETLIAFLKVYEEDSAGGTKSRYLILAVQRTGRVFIHKAKRNSNLSFSKGKTWYLEDVRVLEVMGPSDFALTMTTRRYHWTTERPKDQTAFLTSIVKVYKEYTHGRLPELINFVPPPIQSQPASQQQVPHTGLNEPPSAFPIPRVGNSDLTLPQPFGRSYRANSSSSVNSSQTYGNHYQPSHSESSRGRPSVDDDRSPPSATGTGAFARFPLSDTGRRPSGGDGRAAISPRAVAPGNGVGMGPPPAQRKMSDDRAEKIGLSALRNVSAASEYDSGAAGDASSRMKKSESDMSVIAETETERSVSAGAGGKATQSSRIPSAPVIREHSPSPPPPPPPPPQSTSNPQASEQKPKPAPPTITTTDLSVPSPGLNTSADFSSSPVSATRSSRRASFHPPPLDTTISRDVLLQSRTGLLPGAAGMTIDESEGDDGVLKNVEEMLEGFDWGMSAGGLGLNGEGRKKGADVIENRLLDELTALDSAIIHAFLESDDRTAQVLAHIDEALMELDDIDLQITGYRMQLNAVSDDISYIESQGKGLQVQTSNQQVLLNELRQLLQIVEVPADDLHTLIKEPPSSEQGVKALERAAASLYKALQAGMDTANAEVAATIARMQEYREQSSKFCKRMSDYLDITFQYQADSTLSDFRKNFKKTMALESHQKMGEKLMIYTGLVLYIKEMDDARYQKLCSDYMSRASQLHQSEMRELLTYMASLQLSSGDAGADADFSSAPGANYAKPSALQKSKTVIGLGLGNQPKQEKRTGNNISRAAELYRQAFTQIINQIVIEEDFINAFLRPVDTESTFADYMELDSYFRRQAARHASRARSAGMIQLLRSMMDLIFGFVEVELKNWVEATVEKGPVAIVGIIAVTERLAKEAEEENTSIFFTQLFDKQLLKQRLIMDMFINKQIKSIEASKTIIKRRKGITFFVKHFPVFVERVEQQMDGNGDLPIRVKVNEAYEKVMTSVYGSLEQLAKMERAETQANEDKGQLNYHVIMIENLHCFIEDVSQIKSMAMAGFLQRAKTRFEENMSMYIKLMLRRTFARFIDFFDGVDRLLQSTPANEISLHHSYSRSALKKILKDHGAKDMRKAVETMSRRVDKHFADDEEPNTSTANTALINMVWNELTQEFAKEILRAQGIVAKSYGDSGLGLEFSAADVEATCKKMK
ncbi:exocyst protein [Cryptococcus neoformans Bt85]|nr:exocyst protein [Cryptococcus neoformans var. grubii Bt85]